MESCQPSMSAFETGETNRLLIRSSEELSRVAGLTGEMAQFADLNNFYQVDCSEETGERALAAISGAVDTEYAWAFDRKNESWYHFPSKATSSVNYETGDISYSFDLKATYEFPEDSEIILYHIHPIKEKKEICNRKADVDNIETIFDTQIQIPTEKDMQDCASAYEQEILGYKIVTPLGVTSIEFHPERVKWWHRGIKISLPEDLFSTKKKDSKESVGAIIADLNKKLKGIFALSFKPFE